MKSVFASTAAAAAVAAFALLGPACSSDDPAPFDPDAPVTTCDSSQCAAGNTCLPLDGDLKCRKPCTSNIDPSGSCPASYVCVGSNEPTQLPPEGCTKIANDKQLCAALRTASGTRLTPYACVDTKPVKGCVGTGDGSTFCCNDQPAQQLDAPVCVKTFSTITPGPKQWGTPCLTEGGLANNPACDVDQGFGCYATSPADAEAYCTRYDCTSDRECSPGYGCETLNVAPNAFRNGRSYHEVRSVCVRRQYGSACTADVDCPAIGGVTAHCALDAKLQGFCTPECDKSSSCNVEAKCIDPGVGVKVCYPRADVIVGDGALCSPCRNDAQCGDDGLCVKGAYTTERFCAKKAITCTSSETQCPASASAKTPLGCQRGNASEPSPTDNYCFGLYTIGVPPRQSEDIGCWTPNRE